MGLLHDIGKLLLLQKAIEIDKKDLYDGDISMEELYQTLDTYRGFFGGSLLQEWKFPDSFIHVARYHDDIEAAETASKELMVVHRANLMVKSLGYDLNESSPTDLENAVSARFLRLPPQEIRQIEQHVKQLMENSSALL